MIIAVTLLVALGSLTEMQVYNYAGEAGFNQAEAKTMVCIAKHESAFDPKAINTSNSNGTTDYGLYQINSIWDGKGCRIDKLLDPAYNTACAKRVYDIQGFTAWVAYKKYKDTCDNYELKEPVCPPLVVVDNTDRPWSKRDEMARDLARETCRNRYKPNVCLKEMRRLDDYNFHMVCGL
jgi:hypothetical protein